MNLILVDSSEAMQIWPLADARAEHVRRVLRMGVGESFYVGVPNGPRGKATIQKDDEQGMALAIAWDKEAPAAAPLHLLVGLSRPQTARRVLFEAAVFGVPQLHFFQSERGERSYAYSKLWDGEWERHLHQGAEQAFATTIPKVYHYDSLDMALASLCPPAGWASVALDVYEATAPLPKTLTDRSGAVLAIGPERGWSPQERDSLRKAAYSLASLGERVLKTETACVAAMAVALACGSE